MSELLEKTKQNMAIMITAMSMVFEDEAEYQEDERSAQWAWRNDGMLLTIRISDDGI